MSEFVQTGEDAEALRARVHASLESFDFIESVEVNPYVDAGGDAAARVNVYLKNRDGAGTLYDEAMLRPVREAVTEAFKAVSTQLWPYVTFFQRAEIRWPPADADLVDEL